MTRRRGLWWTALVILAGMVGCTLLASHLAQERALRQESEDVQRQLTLYGQAMAQRIDRFRTLPEVLALDPQLRDALAQPLTVAQAQAVNRKLEQANGASQSSTLTLIDRQGTAIAASNWRDTHSNVGENYSFRPYVRQALTQGQGRFYGIGLTTGEPGYFLSTAIRDEQGRILGLVAIKIALSELEHEWLISPDIVLASDAHGVIFLASRDAWRYRLLAPLDEQGQQDLAATRQYADQPLTPLRYRSERPLAGGAMLVRLHDPAEPQPLLWQTLALPGSDWKLHLLHHTRAVAAAGRLAGLAAAGLWLALALLVLFVRQRRRLTRLRIKSRQELETVLQQHAQELRTAQDAIVQAARAACTMASCAVRSSCACCCSTVSSSCRLLMRSRVRRRRWRTNSTSSARASHSPAAARPASRPAAATARVWCSRCSFQSLPGSASVCHRSGWGSAGSCRRTSMAPPASGRSLR